MTMMMKITKNDFTFDSILLFQYTINMKKVEVPVRRIIEGQKLTATGSLANPNCLDYYRNIPELNQW